MAIQELRRVPNPQSLIPNPQYKEPPQAYLCTPRAALITNRRVCYSWGTRSHSAGLNFAGDT